MHLNEFIDLDKFQDVVDLGRSFCFSFKSKMSYCGTFSTLDLIPLDLIPLDLILEVISFRSYSIRSYSNLPIRSYSCLPGIVSKGIISKRHSGIISKTNMARIIFRE